MEDLWNNVIPKLQYLELFSFCKVKELTIGKVLATILILQVLLDLQGGMRQKASTTFSFLNVKHYIWVWGTQSLTSTEAYKVLTGHVELPASYKWLWKSCQLKHKTFFWLLVGLCVICPIAQRPINHVHIVVVSLWRNVYQKFPNSSTWCLSQWETRGWERRKW